MASRYRLCLQPLERPAAISARSQTVRAVTGPKTDRKLAANESKPIRCVLNLPSWMYAQAMLHCAQCRLV